MATDANRRRIKALTIVERVKKLDTEQLAREAGELRRQMATFESEKQALLRRISSESRVDGVEGGAYLGRFIRAARAEVERVSAKMSELRPDLDAAEDRLRAALSEQKMYEILRLTRLTEERNASRKREAARLDEIARQTWRP